VSPKIRQPFCNGSAEKFSLKVAAPPTEAATIPHKMNKTARII
jgi:hypothetical protein